MSHVVAFVYHFARQNFNLNHYSASVKNVAIGAFRSALPLQVPESTWQGAGGSLVNGVPSGVVRGGESERGRYWLQLRGGPYLSRTHFGVHFGSKGGVKKRPLLGTPVWSSFLPILAPFGQHSGPLGFQMESKMEPKRGPKRSQEKE